MSPEIKKLSHSEIELTVTVAWEDWKQSVSHAVKELAKEIKADGFRPGKAPRDIVEQRVGSGAILELAAEDAVRRSYSKVIEAEKIDAIGSPKIEILKLAEGNELQYRARTAVVPEIALSNWEKSIKKVNKEHREKGEPKVADEEIGKELEKLAKSRAKLVTVDREVREGDNVLVDFQVFQNGVPIEGGTSKKHPLVIGSGVFIPGFEEELRGMKFGDEKEFELPFPAEYHAKHLAGKPATFKVKMHEVQERQISAVNDEFAKSLSKFDTLEKLKDSIRKGMIEEKKLAAKDSWRAAIVDALAEHATVDLPAMLVDGELEKMIGEFEGQIQGMGMSFEQYLETIKKTKTDLEKEWRPQAEKRLIAAMAIEAVAKEREITVPAERIEEEMNKTLNRYKQVKDAEKNIDLARLYNYVKGTLVNEEVMEVLEKL